MASVNDDCRGAVSDDSWTVLALDVAAEEDEVGGDCSGAREPSVAVHVDFSQVRQGEDSSWEGPCELVACQVQLVEEGHLPNALRNCACDSVCV